MKYRALIDEWVEGGISSAAELQLRSHVRSCPACRAEFDVMDLLRSDLESLGDTLAQRAPVRSIAPAVMSAVRAVRARESRRAASGRWFRRRILPWAAVTAAAAAMIFIVWGSTFRDTGDPRPRVAKTDSGKTSKDARNTGKAASAGTVDKSELKTRQVEEVKKLALENLLLNTGAAGTQQEGFASVQDISLEDVLAARRDALSDPGARAALNKWATLTVERARELINGAADSKGELGAAMMLPNGEAQPLLLAAAELNNDPYLKYRVATSYGKNHETVAKAVAQFSELSSADSDNALSRYEYAAACLGQGDTLNGINALLEAQGMDTVDAYTSSAAEYKEQALVAAGASPEVARALAAFTAGNQEYGELVNLGNQLLDYGRYYEQNGDTQTAEQIYEAVRSFGMQVSSSSSYSSEQLAGLDIERAAVEVLSNLMSFIEVPENMQALAEETQHLVDSFASISEMMNSLNDFFGQTQDAPLLNMAIDFLFQNGDMDLMEYLRQNSGQTR